MCFEHIQTWPVTATLHSFANKYPDSGLKHFGY